MAQGQARKRAAKGAARRKGARVAGNIVLRKINTPRFKGIQGAPSVIKCVEAALLCGAATTFTRQCAQRRVAGGCREGRKRD